MDIGTHAYSTACRFFRDDATVGTIEWREALPDAECLPYSSGIVNLDWELDKAWIQQDYGEVWGAPRPFNTLRPPRGLKGIPCGSVRDFQIGSIYDDDRPPLQYTKFGYPLCCGGVVGMLGGAGASGHALVHTNANVDPTVGGLELGGEAGDTIAFIDPASGGLELGGEAGDVYSGGSSVLPPGSSDCSTPTALALGVTYIGTVPTSGTNNFFTVPLAGVGTWHVTVTGMVSGEIFWYVYYTNPFCSNFDVDHGTENGCLTKVVPTGGTLAIDLVANNPAQPITLRIDPGACPVSYVDPTEGGSEIGGEGGDSIAFIDPAEGGLELGGETGDEYTPGSSSPGATCATAGVLIKGTTGYTDSFPPFTEWWFTLATTGGATYHVTVSFTGTGFTSAAVQKGVCGSQSTITTVFNNGCADFVADVGGVYYLHVTNASGSLTVTPTVKFLDGPC